MRLDNNRNKEILSLIEGKDNCKYLGMLQPNEFISFYNKIDVLIIPSFAESGPLSGLEAMAAGRIILSTRVGAMPERLEGTKNDFWFDLSDENSFLTQINRITELSSNQIEEICISIRKRYQTRYTMTSLVNQYALCVENLFKKKL